MRLKDLLFTFVKELGDFSYEMSVLDQVWNVLFPDKGKKWHCLHVNKQRHTFYITHVGSGADLEINLKNGVQPISSLGRSLHSAENLDQLSMTWEPLITSAHRWMKVVRKDWIKANKQIQVGYPLSYRYGLAPNALIRFSLPDAYRLDKELGSKKTLQLIHLVEDGFFLKPENTEVGSMTAAYNFEEKIQIELDWSLAISGAKSAFAQMYTEAQQAFISDLSQSARGQEILDAMFAGGAENEFYKKFYSKKQGVSLGTNIGKDVGETLFVTFTDTIKQLAETEDVVSSLMGKSMKGELDLSDVAKMPAEYIDALSIQGDKISLNIDLLKELQIEQSRTALDAIKNAQEAGLATEQEVAIVQFAYDQLMESSQRTFSQFNLTAWQYDELLWTIANRGGYRWYQFFP